MRPLRIEFPGAHYHVINRGLEKRNIFSDAQDFSFFLRLCQQAKRLYNFEVYSYCLMNNHYHLFLRTNEGNLAKIMKYINGIYAQYFNQRYERVGPLFQGRYKSPLVQLDSYAMQLAKYIHLNPVQARLVNYPDEWLWSSFSSYIKQSTDSLLTKDLLLNYYNGIQNLHEYTLTQATLSHEEEKLLFENQAMIADTDFKNQVTKQYLKKDRSISYDISNRQTWEKLRNI